MNLDEEIKHGYKISSNQKKVWAIEIDLVKKLLSVCDKYKLKIWADGGTLLGAVREKGFIPWDDDIDMGMMREDYDKLLEVSTTEFKTPYFFQSAFSDVDYPHGHAQLRKDGTTAILTDDLFCKFHQGIFVDIFVYDSIPDNVTDIKRLRRKTQKYYKAIHNYCYGMPVYRWMVDPIHCLLYKFYFERTIKRIGFRNFFKEYENLFRCNNCDRNRKVGAIEFAFDRNVKHNLNKEYFINVIWTEFENIKIPIPYRYHEVLTSMYGDYMTPKEAPSVHCGFAFVDPERSYTEYLPAMRDRYRDERYSRFVKKIAHKLFGGEKYIFHP